MTMRKKRTEEAHPYEHRSQTTRSAEQRDKEIRDNILGAARTILDTAPTPPDGMEYRWARECFKEGHPDNSRIAELSRTGWRPVPADRHPQLVAEDYLGRQNSTRGYILIRGLLLVEREAKWGVLSQEKKQRELEKTMRDIPDADKLIGVPNIQVVNGSRLDVTLANRPYGGF